jgi:hypothetical protein
VPVGTVASRGRRAIATGLYELKTLVAPHPVLALPLQRMRGQGVVVGPNTQIVIEGYPRVASSFAVAAFRLAQEPAWVEVAEHTHMPAQVIEATRRGIPALVLIRRPREAVVSFLIYFPDRSARSAVHGYLRFYEPLLRLRSRIVVATFDEVVTDLGAPIERVNQRFGTSFHPFVHSPENLARIRGEIDADHAERGDSPERAERRLARPTETREAMKAAVAREYELAPEHLRRRAERVYTLLTGSA